MISLAATLGTACTAVGPERSERAGSVSLDPGADGAGTEWFLYANALGEPTSICRNHDTCVSLTGSLADTVAALDEVGIDEAEVFVAAGLFAASNDDRSDHGRLEPRTCSAVAVGAGVLAIAGFALYQVRARGAATTALPGFIRRLERESNRRVVWGDVLEQLDRRGRGQSFYMAIHAVVQPHIDEMWGAAYRRSGLHNEAAVVVRERLELLVQQVPVPSTSQAADALFGRFRRGYTGTLDTGRNISITEDQLEMFLRPAVAQRALADIAEARSLVEAAPALLRTVAAIDGVATSFLVAACQTLELSPR